MKQVIIESFKSFEITRQSFADSSEYEITTDNDSYWMDNLEVYYSFQGFIGCDKMQVPLQRLTPSPQDHSLYMISVTKNQQNAKNRIIKSLKMQSLLPSSCQKLLS
jgi:hypothetical protein